MGPEGFVAAICSSRGKERVKASRLASPPFILDYTHPYETILGPDSPLNNPAVITFDCIYDTVTSPDASDGLEGKPYDEVLMPKHLSKKGKYIAVNGNEKRWAAALSGLQGLSFGSQYRLIMVSLQVFPFI